MSYEEINDINIYDTIVYIGSLYAGGVLGMKKTVFGYNAGTDKKLIVVTVGLADPADMENPDHIKDGVKKQLPAGVYEKATVMHFRNAKDLPEEKKNAEVRAMIETLEYPNIIT